MPATAHLVLPRQLFDAQLDTAPEAGLILLEHDLLIRQLPFHAHKLVLHRASLRRFARRARSRGRTVHVLDSRGDRSSRSQLTTLLRRLGVERVTCVDVVDDWVSRDIAAALVDAGITLHPDDVLESPGFLTDRSSLWDQLGGESPRMADFYRWQRRRLGVLVGADGSPAGGRWSFDTENRKRLPRGHQPPPVTLVEPEDPDVIAAIAWVHKEFPDAPGDPATFCWPTAPDEARALLDQFVEERLRTFGPYEDAIATAYPFVYHSVLTPALNAGLLTPDQVLDAVLTEHAREPVDLPSLEGFVRQLIGWREYMRGLYHVRGRALRTADRLGFTRDLPPGWWDGSTGLDPVDHVIRRVLDTGYAHHIERLMVLGNALLLERVRPDAVYAWFAAMFVDAYDWVMVPNVYAMSQFAAGDAATTKPYISGSRYIRSMSDIDAGPWTAAWDGLYWSFVDDHVELFRANRRTAMIAAQWERMDPDRRRAHGEAAAPWLPAGPGTEA